MVARPFNCEYLVFFNRGEKDKEPGRMQAWKKVLLLVFPSAIVLGLILLFLRRRCCHKKTEDFPATTTRAGSLQSGTDKLHLPYDYSRKGRASSHYQPQNHHRHHHLYDHANSRKQKLANNIVWRNGLSGKRFFYWDDNPSLVSAAVENGWAKFAFSGFPSSPSSRTVWGLCGISDYELESDVEVTWEIDSGSADYMQRIRLNPKIKQSKDDSLWVSSVRTGLPLPGPRLDGSSFPQEAYLEITILSQGEPQFALGIQKSFSDSTRLISEASMKAQFDDHVYRHVKSSRKLEPSKFVIQEEIKDTVHPTTTTTTDKLISLGLSGENPPPFRFPGCYPESIGFDSDGFVSLDGIVENTARKIAAWGSANTVIGLGFDTAQKRVFFTVDSELVHTIYCESEIFSNPLFATLAANFDVTVLVNLGQSPFKYSPANTQRTPDPCFLRPSFPNAATAALGYEDSRELFSIGRIDSQWRNRSTINKKAVGDGDEMDSEADLFEIILDDASSRK